MDAEKILPEVKLGECNGCGACIEVCPEEALAILDEVAVLIGGVDDCSYCGDCEAVCPTGAISCPYEIVVEE